NSRVNASKSIVDVVCRLTLTVTISPVVFSFRRNTAGLGLPVKVSMLRFAKIGLMRFSFFDRPQAGADAATSRRATRATARRAKGRPESGGVCGLRRVQDGDIEKNGLPLMRRAGSIPAQGGPGKRGLHPGRIRRGGRAARDASAGGRTLL